MKTEFIKWWKKDPLRNSINCIDFICAITAIITGGLTVLNISGAIMDLHPGDCAREITYAFVISFGIWIILSIFPFVREFRKMF